MVRTHDVPVVAPSMLALIAAEARALSYALDSEGPASAPTVLVEAEATSVPTALPAPPLVPHIASEWRPPPLSPLPALRPALALVRTARRASLRPPVCISELRSHERLRACRPSSPPPTMPPPSPMMRRAA